MPLSRGLEPEFGYFCLSPNLRRTLSVALAFTVFGLVAWASGVALLLADNDPDLRSGVALLVADNDPDPRSAFALSPLPSPSRETAAPPAATAEIPAVDTVPARKVTRADGIKSCRHNASDNVGANCDFVAARKPGVVHAVTDPPATAEIPTGPSKAPAIAAPEPAVLVASTSPLKAGAPEPMEAVPFSIIAEERVPEGSATKPRQTARHQSRRHNLYEDSPLWAFDQLFRSGGYARQRPRTLFW